MEEMKKSFRDTEQRIRRENREGEMLEEHWPMLGLEFSKID